MSANKTLDFALALGKAGFNVFPCRRHDRRPATLNGFKDATNDEVVIRRWFEGNPNLNLAIACGPQPNGLNLVALDIDPQNGGLESWAEWVAEHPAPETARHETPSGGFHLFFDAPDEVRPGVNKIGQGIDVRASGSYVVAPPSIAPSKMTGELLPYQTNRANFVGAGTVAPLPVDYQVQLALVANGTPLPTVSESVQHHPSQGRSVSLRAVEGDSVADLARQDWVWEEELDADDWTFVRQHGGDQEWTRPGKNPRDGTSATLHNDGDGPLVVWSTSLPDGGKATVGGAGQSYSPWDYIVTFRCGGDRKAAARLVRGAAPSVTPGEDRPPGEPENSPPDLYLPDSFWSATPLLAEIRSHALARLRTPDAVLAALLTMYATTIPMGIWLPGLVGAQAPLNLYAVVVGKSGGGKTSAMTLASKLMGSPGNKDILMRKQLRSGEGLITLVNKGKPTEGEPAPTRVGVHVHYDEGGTLSRQQFHSANTIIPNLNTCWSGAGEVGGAKANEEAGFDASRVRICALIGVQYKIGANLFTGEAATLGFPQRLLFLSADGHPDIQDQEMPDEIIEPEPIGLPFLRHSDYTRTPAFVTLPRSVRQEVWDWSKTTPAPLDGHAMVLRLRVATILQLMHGEGDINFERWWGLSEVIMTTHRVVRHTFIESHQQVKDEADRGIGISQGRRKEAEHEYALDKGVDSLVTKLNGGPLPTKAIKDHFRSWKKRYGIDHRDIIERAQLLGKVVQEGPDWRKS